MSEDLLVTQATIEDLADLVPLFDQYRMFYGQPSDPAGAELFLWNKFEHRESVVFIARHRKTCQPAGFTQLYPSFSSVSMQRAWILNDLFVEPSFRGKGTAGLLLEAAKQYGISTKAKGIQLSTAPDNHVAQKLYETHGYMRDETFYHYFLKL
jgi:ribosomal protein S18 acetylase RimI-like enzyme